MPDETKGSSRKIGSIGTTLEIFLKCHVAYVIDAGLFGRLPFASSRSALSLRQADAKQMQIVECQYSPRSQNRYWATFIDGNDVIDTA
jgi:hypothetical protein